MSATPPTDSDDLRGIPLSDLDSPTTDIDALRRNPAVPVHADKEVLDSEQITALGKLDDLVIVGLTNEDGDVLLRKATADCSLKLPCGAVSRGDDYAAVAREALSATGVDGDLAALVGVWGVEARTADGSRTADRWFVVFEAAPADDNEATETPPADADVFAADWYETLPEGAAQLPGTEIFVE